MVLPYINMNLPQVYTCSPSWTLLSPPSPYHPSGSSQCISAKHPVLCIEPGLATRFIYDIIHVSMPFSQIIPPSPSPTESKRLFYMSVAHFKQTDIFSSINCNKCKEFNFMFIYSLSKLFFSLYRSKFLPMLFSFFLKNSLTFYAGQVCCWWIPPFMFIWESFLFSFTFEGYFC